MVDGSNESLYRPDEESDAILRKGIPLQTSFLKVDVSSKMGQSGIRQNVGDSSFFYAEWIAHCPDAAT